MLSLTCQHTQEATEHERQPVAEGQRHGSAGSCPWHQHARSMHRVLTCKSDVCSHKNSRSTRPADTAVADTMHDSFAVHPQRGGRVGEGKRGGTCARACRHADA